MEKVEESYIKCKKLTLELLFLESEMTKLEIQQMEVKLQLRNAIKEAEKLAKESIDDVD